MPQTIVHPIHRISAEKPAHIIVRRFDSPAAVEFSLEIVNGSLDSHLHIHFHSREVFLALLELMSSADIPDCSQEGMEAFSALIPAQKEPPPF